MIAVDTSSFVEFLNGGQGNDIECLAQALRDKVMLLPPPVLTELISYPFLTQEMKSDLLLLPLVPWSVEFWELAGVMRQKLLKKKLKVRLADALIVQCCLSHQIPLITRDRDFKHYEKNFGLIVQWN